MATTRGIAHIVAVRAKLMGIVDLVAGIISFSCSTLILLENENLTFTPASFRVMIIDFCSFSFTTPALEFSPTW